MHYNFDCYGFAASEKAVALVSNREFRDQPPMRDFGNLHTINLNSLALALSRDYRTIGSTSNTSLFVVELSKFL